MPVIRIRESRQLLENEDRVRTAIANGREGANDRVDVVVRTDETRAEEHECVVIYARDGPPATSRGGRDVNDLDTEPDDPDLRPRDSTTQDLGKRIGVGENEIRGGDGACVRRATYRALRLV